MDSSQVFGGSMLLLSLLFVVCLVLFVFILCLVLNFSCLWIVNSWLSLMFTQLNIICCRSQHTFKESGISQTPGINSASVLGMSCISEAFQTPNERTKDTSILKDYVLYLYPGFQGVVAMLADDGHSNTYYVTFQIT